MKHIWIFERAICPWALDGPLFWYCCRRDLRLLRFLLSRLAGLLLSLFGLPLGKRLRWRFLSSSDPALLRKFWETKAKRLPALSVAEGQSWLTRLPPEAVQPLAERANALLFSGGRWPELAQKAGTELPLADAWPPCVKGAPVTYVLRGKLLPSAGSWLLRRALHILYTLLALCVLGVGLGLLSLYFATGSYQMEMFRTYFSVPLLPVLNVLPVLLLVLLLYLFFNRVWLAFAAASLLTMGLSLADYFKLSLRNDPMLFSDIAYASEGSKMALARYSLTFTWKIWLAIAIILISLLLAIRLVRGRVRSGRLRLLGIALLCLLAVFGCRRYYFSQPIYNATANNVLVSPWSATGQFVSRGFVYPFLHSIQSARETPPEGYSEAEAKAILANYPYTQMPDGKKVHIVSVMLEAYNDFSKFGAPKLTDAVYGPLHALEAKSYHGELITNIFAGGTVDTEWGFLTGFSRAADFRSDAHSHVRYLKEQGYYAEGGHPCYDWFYNRRNVNQYLGFDNYYFFENKYGAVNGTILQDDLFFPDLYQMLETHLQSSDQPYFSFSVTYQNHGPYEAERCYYPGDYVVNEGYTEAEYNILQNYFGGVANTTQNVVKLAEQIEAMAEPVVYIVFGDHNPWMGNSNSVYQRLGIDLNLSDSEGFRNYYGTPYLIYANPAAKEALGFDFVGEGPSISPCFLMNLFFRLSGITGNEYMQLANEMMDASPVVHASNLFWQNGEITAQPDETSRERYRRFRIGQYYWRWSGYGR